MADAPKDSDQSMEDILQSIKRIIADEGETPAAAAAPTAGSDVLELTELLAEDVAVPQPEAAAPAPEAPAPTLSLDELMAEAPAAPAAPAPEPMPMPMPMPVSMTVEPEPEPEPEPVAPEPIVPAYVPPPAAPVAPPTVISTEGLMSNDALAASVAALHALSKNASSHESVSPGANFRSGTTVEDLALEVIRPLVKEWLDGNLPALVRQLVEREIRRLRVD